MTLFFANEDVMKDEVGWVPQVGETCYHKTCFNEELEFNPMTLEILTATGFENFIGTLLQEGKIKIR